MPSAKYMRDYLKRNPDQKKKSDDRWKKRARESDKRLTAFVNRLKCKPCSDCGVQYNPWVMDFDHHNPKSKKYTIANMANNNMSEKKILEEAAKCDVVCSNCHRERTHRQRQNGEI